MSDEESSSNADTKTEDLLQGNNDLTREVLPQSGLVVFKRSGSEIFNLDIESQVKSYISASASGRQTVYTTTRNNSFKKDECNDDVGEHAKVKPKVKSSFIPSSYGSTSTPISNPQFYPEVSEGAPLLRAQSSLLSFQKQPTVREENDQILPQSKTFHAGLKRANSTIAYSDISGEFSERGLRDDVSLDVQSTTASLVSSAHPSTSALSDNVCLSTSSTDELMISQSLRDAVHYSFGVVAAEVYIADNSLHDFHGVNEGESSISPLNSPVMDTRKYRITSSLSSGIMKIFGSSSDKVLRESEQNNKVYQLKQPKGGWFVDPIYAAPSDDAADALGSLQDTLHTSYAPPLPTVPGVGAAGIMWSESSSSDCLSASWRDLKSLGLDPFQQPDERLRLLTRAFGKAAGITFDINGFKGIVLFYARKSSKDIDLSSEENLIFLRTSANLIGAICAWHNPRKKAILSRNKRRAQRTTLLRRNSSFLLQKVKSSTNLSSFDETEKVQQNRKHFIYKMSKMYQNLNIFVFDRSQVWAKKCKGSGLKPPPSFPAGQAFESFIGSFLSLLILSIANESMKYFSSGKVSVVLGPFGALAILQFTLTAAPAAQPRNAILGTAFSSIISVLLNEVPVEIIPIYIKVALAPSLTAALLARLSLQHPPAGATSIVYILGNKRWSAIPPNLFLVILAILLSTCLNNLSDCRQYPTFWGFEKSFLFEHPGILSSFTRPRKKKSLKINGKR